jgi:hypothetical protein
MVDALISYLDEGDVWGVETVEAGSRYKYTHFSFGSLSCHMDNLKMPIETIAIIETCTVYFQATM